MLITYDREADALAIDLLPTATRARTERLRPGVFAHYDGEDRLIELEVLGASARYPRAELERVGTPADWLTLAEAAKEAALSPATLRSQIHKGRLKAEKRGHDWLVSRAGLWNYLENRAPQGRPPARPKRRRAPATR